jgi:hypothetical protein
MMIDTTYWLPLVGIAVKADLLKDIVEGGIKDHLLEDLAIAKYPY